MKNIWSKKRLGEVSTIFNGNSINEDEKKEKYLGSVGTPYISTKDIGFDGGIDFENGVLIPKDEAHKFKIVEANSVLICAEGGSAGRKLAHTDRNIFFGNKLFALTSNNKIDSKFVFYFYQSEEFYSLFRSKMSGLIGGVSINKFKEIEIPLPPIDEQKRIVKILDEVFDSVAKAKETAEKNLKNAREVFESYLQSVFFDSKNGWEVKKLKEICDYDKTPNKKANLPYVGLEDIESNTARLIGPLSPRSVKSLTFNFTEEHVLYGRLRPYLNKVLLPNFEGHCSTEIFPIKPKKNLDREFLFRWLTCSETVKKINSTWTGATLPRANMNEVLEFLITIPPLDQQKKIVIKLDALSAETKKLEEIYKQKLTHLEELKKSILKKAFNGEL